MTDVFQNSENLVEFLPLQALPYRFIMTTKQVQRHTERSGSWKSSNSSSCFDDVLSMLDTDMAILSDLTRPNTACPLLLT